MKNESAPYYITAGDLRRMAPLWLNITETIVNYTHLVCFRSVDFDLSQNTFDVLWSRFNIRIRTFNGQLRAGVLFVCVCVFGCVCVCVRSSLIFSSSWILWMFCVLCFMCVFSLFVCLFVYLVWLVFLLHDRVILLVGFAKCTRTLWRQLLLICDIRCCMIKCKLPARTWFSFLLYIYFLFNVPKLINKSIKQTLSIVS